MPKKIKPFVSLDILVLLVSLITTFIAWRIAATFPPEQIPIYVFILGMGASFLLFGMVFGLTRAEKKATEADIEHSRLLSAIESIPFGLAITDTEGTIVLSNYGLSEVLIDVGGVWSLQKIDEKFKGEFSVSDSYRKVLAEKRSLAWKRVDFGSKKLDIYMAPIFSEKEGILGVLILIRDATQV